MAYNLKSAKISFSTSGDNSVITAASSGPIKVYGIFFTVSGATTITYKNGSTALSDPIDLTAAGSSQTLQINKDFYFACDPGNDFIMNSLNAVNVAGTVYYTQGG